MLGNGNKSRTPGEQEAESEKEKMGGNIKTGGALCACVDGVDKRAKCKGPSLHKQPERGKGGAGGG